MSRTPSPGSVPAVRPGTGPGPGEERRSLALSYGLWCLSLVGICGIQRIYNRKPVTGLLWLFTFGLCGIGQLVDLLLIPQMVDAANRAGALAPQGPAAIPISRQLLRLARQKGAQGFTLNDALIELDLPAQLDTVSLQNEIERLLLEHLLEIGNDERGRVIYREP